MPTRDFPAGFSPALLGVNSSGRCRSLRKDETVDVEPILIFVLAAVPVVAVVRWVAGRTGLPAAAWSRAAGQRDPRLGGDDAARLPGVVTGGAHAAHSATSSSAACSRRRHTS